MAKIGYETVEVLGGAYRGSTKTMLSHVVVSEDDQWVRVLCGRVNVHNVTNSCEEDDVPTCKTCARRDPRSQ